MYEYLDSQIRDSTYVGQTNVKSLSEDSLGLSKFRDASGAHSHGVEQKDNPGKSSMSRAQNGGTGHPPFPSKIGQGDLTKSILIDNFSLESGCGALNESNHYSEY